MLPNYNDNSDYDNIFSTCFSVFKCDVKHKAK